MSAAAIATALVAAGALAGLPARPASAMEGGGFAGDAKCALCHEAIAASLDAASHGRVTGREHLCEDCHGPGADHVGTAGNREKIRSFRTAPPREATDACLACHREGGSEHVRGFRGGPLETRGSTCTSCHRVHVRAPSAPAPAPRAAATTATCRACHADDVYGARFAHAGLEWDAPACASCHPGGDAHARDPAARGLVTNPARGDAATEVALCTSCHGAYGRADHFASAPADARCATCHALHRDAGTGSRAVPGAAPAGRRGPDDAAMRAAETFLRGSVRVGARAVGGERGRYEEHGLPDDGLRVLLLRLEMGEDDPDPRAARGSLRLEGLGDPHETLDLRVRRPGAWTAEARGSRFERPFLGGGGLHPGETLRERWSASLDATLSPSVRVSAGHDALTVEGDVRGTLLDGGAVVPVVGRQDRADDETWASVDAAGDRWRVGLRQAWRSEDGTDDRDRAVATPAGADFLAWRDGSTAQGPVTSITAGGDALEGALSFDASASLARFERDVDLRERRRGFAGTAPFSRTTSLDGDAVRDLTRFALAVDWAPAEDWALEAAIERRSLREERDLASRLVLVTDLGTTVTTGALDDGLRQAITDARLGARWKPREGWTLRGGAERRSDALSGTGAADGSVRSAGGYLGLDADLGRGWEASLEGRTTDARGAYTALTPEDRASLSARLDWRGEDGRRFRASWRRTRLDADRSGLASEGDAAAVAGGIGAEDGVTFDAGVAWRRLDLSVDALGFAGGGLRGAGTSSLVRALSVDAAVGVPVVGPLRAEARGAWTRDRGDLAVRAWDASLALLWRPPGAVSAGIRLRRRRYDESGEGRGDYDARILEAFVEIQF